MAYFGPFRTSNMAVIRPSRDLNTLNIPQTYSNMLQIPPMCIATSHMLFGLEITQNADSKFHSAAISIIPCSYRTPCSCVPGVSKPLSFSSTHLKLLQDLRSGLYKIPWKYDHVNPPSEWAEAKKTFKKMRAMYTGTQEHRNTGTQEHGPHFSDFELLLLTQMEEWHAHTFIIS